MFDPTPVRFQLDPPLADIAEGWFEIHGVLRAEGGLLVMEYAKKNAVSEQSEVVAHEFSLDDLAMVSYKKGVFGDKLTLQANSMTLFESIPGSKGDVLVLSVRRRARPEAHALAWRLGSVLENRKLS